MRLCYPIEVRTLARLDLADRRVFADRTPDLLLELAGGDIIAEEGVVYSQYTSARVAITTYGAPYADINVMTYSTRSVQATGPYPRNGQPHNQ